MKFAPVPPFRLNSPPSQKIATACSAFSYISYPLFCDLLSMAFFYASRFRRIAHHGARMCLSSSLVFLAAALASPLAFALPVDDARRLIAEGRHVQALDLLDEQLKKQPQDVQARFLKGVALMKLNRLQDAEPIFKKLTEDRPSLPEPYNNLAVIYAEQKQYDKAREALEAAIRTHPAYAVAHENLGDVYASLARQAYGKALQLESTNAAAQSKLAIINELIDASRKGKPSTSSATDETKAAPAKPSGASAPAPDKAVVPASPAPAPATAAAPSAMPQPAGAADTGAKSAPEKAGEAEIAAVVDEWLAAWSRKDFKKYLSFYADDFVPSKGMTRQNWEAERNQRLSKPGPIKVERERLAIVASAPDAITVRFRQHYSSAGFKSSSNKSLTLARRGGVWKIVREKAG